MVSLRQVCFFVSIVVLIVKGIIALKLPLFADEAYYMAWGLKFQGGYYDLPPFVGWITSLGPALGIPFEVLRVFPIFFHFILAFLGAWIAGPLAYLILIAHPFLVGFVSLSPDWPLVFFLSIATALALKGAKLTPKFAAALGLLIGLSFLSKYFAVLFVLPLALKFRTQPKQILMVGLAALPALLQHLWWNQNHCMENFAFNLITRQAVSDGSTLQTFGLFLLYLLVWATPVGIYAFWKSRRSWRATSFQVASFGLFPIAVFAVTAIFKGQGIHWYMGFFPWILVGLALALGSAFPLRAYLAQSLSFFSLLILVLLTESIWAPHFLTERQQNDLAFAKARPEIALNLTTENFDAVITDNYSYASILSLALYEAGRTEPVGVIGEGNRFGRAFDEWMPWAELVGKRFLFIGRGVPEAGAFSDYFDHVAGADFLQVGDARVAWISASGFRARAYLDQVGAKILRQFYPKLPLERACSMREGWL